MRVRVSVPAERKMTLYLLHSLFVYVFKFALSASKEMALEFSLCPVNSSTKHNCVNTAWNPKNCTVLSGPGTFCVNRTLNPTLCKGQPPLQLIKGPINDSDESFYKPPTPKYPLPASENTLYLVGYSRPLNKSEYSCVASTFNKMAGGFIHRTLFLKRAPANTPSDTSYYVLYDNEFDFNLSADKARCEGTVSDVSSDMELDAADRIDRHKGTTTVFYLGEE
ncbi:uncharacterized protein LOC119179712 isoform X4 [Rhipicephalus microplus]|uniref:uncharacterized protein LOC119179712 isoform X4 n=1 Tax=Rhipicephalus microplus TaxID=6941 RepID=UPI003F6B69F2